VRPWRSRDSRAADTRQPTVSTSSRALRRAGAWRSRAAANPCGACRRQPPRAAWAGPISPAHRSGGGNRGASSAWVARMPPPVGRYGPDARRSAWRAPRRAERRPNQVGCLGLGAPAGQRVGEGGRGAGLPPRPVEAHPARPDAPIARAHYRRTSVRRERSPRQRIGLGSDRLGCAHAGGAPSAPRRPRRGAWRTGRCPRAGSVGDQARRASGDRPRRQRGGEERAAVVRGPC
jgi:hypothetical protein